MEKYDYINITLLIIMRVYTDEYGVNKVFECVGTSIRMATFLVDELGLYLEGFKIINDSAMVYSYRGKKMMIINTTRVEVLETRERCNVIKWLKKDYGRSDSIEHHEHVLNTTFPCTLKRDFWRVARIVWIGHYKNRGSMFNTLPRDMIRVVLKTLFAEMARLHIG